MGTNMPCRWFQGMLATSVEYGTMYAVTRTWVCPLGVVRIPAYRYPYQVSSSSSRGARSCRQNFHDIAFDGYPGLSDPSSGMSSIPFHWCRCEMWAVSILPSIACTQLQYDTCFVAMTSAVPSPSVPKS